MRMFHGLALLGFLACKSDPASPPPPVSASATVEPPRASSSKSGAPVAASATASASGGASLGPARLATKPIPLPGAAGSASASPRGSSAPSRSSELALDYLAAERGAGRVWVPAAGSGSVDVIDGATGNVTRIEGFPTAEREGRSGKRKVGPSSVTIGEGFAYVGNRANSEVCAVDLAKLTKGACLTLASPPDGLAYVAATKEVWATTPKDKSITVLDAGKPGKLSAKAILKVDGEPEGYAVDEARGVFFTNLEDADKTLLIDVKTRKVTATWDARCGSDGPRGLAFDASKSFLFVACTDQVKVLDVAHGGPEIASMPLGKGIDNIDYVEPRHELYIAAGGPGTLTVARVDPSGTLSVAAIGSTAPGVRVVVATADGVAYAADGKKGRILELRPKN